jgi:parvulin-like peptidyl-prolyl isomerase
MSACRKTPPVGIGLSSCATKAFAPTSVPAVARLPIRFRAAVIRGGMKLTCQAFTAGFWLLLAAGCGRETSGPPMPDNAVATVGEAVITKEAFLTQLSRRNRPGRGEPLPPDVTQSVLEEMIRFEVLHQKALEAGYDRRPEVLTEVKQLLVARYREDQFRQAAVTPLTPVELRAYYDAHPDRFGLPEQARAAVIELRVSRTASPQKRLELANRAQGILVEAAGQPVLDGTFGLLAQQHSEDQASRYRGGDTGWVTRGATNAAWPPAVINAVFQLHQPGEFAPVVETPLAFYLVKLVERRPAAVRPFDEVAEGVRWLATRERADQQAAALYRRLQEGLNIRVKESFLTSVVVGFPETQPPELPAAVSARSR